MCIYEGVGEIWIKSKKYTLYVGLNDKDTKTQKIDTIEAYKIIENLLVNKVDGGTIFEANGVYKHEDGTVVIEKTLRVEIMFATDTQIKEIVEYLKIILNQESIAVQKEEITSELM